MGDENPAVLCLLQKAVNAAATPCFIHIDLGRGMPFLTQKILGEVGDMAFAIGLQFHETCDKTAGFGKLKLWVVQFE